MRVVRADYCGDGDSWTTVGNALQLKDKWGYSGFAGTPGPTEALVDRQRRRLPRYAALGYRVQVLGTTCNGAKLEPCKLDADLDTYANTVFWSTLP